MFLQVGVPHSLPQLGRTQRSSPQSPGWQHWSLLQLGCYSAVECWTGKKNIVHVLHSTKHVIFGPARFILLLVTKVTYRVTVFYPKSSTKGSSKTLLLCRSPLNPLALHAVCCAAGAGCRDGAHAEPAPERRRGFWKHSESLRGLRLSQWQALPVQGWGHLHLQWESGVLDRDSLIR